MGITRAAWAGGSKEKEEGKRSRRVDRALAPSALSESHVHARPWASCGKRQPHRPQQEGWSGHRHTPSARLLLSDLVTPLPQGSTPVNGTTMTPTSHAEPGVPSSPRPCGFCLSNVHEAALSSISSGLHCCAATHTLWTSASLLAQAPECFLQWIHKKVTTVEGKKLCMGSTTWASPRNQVDLAKVIGKCVQLVNSTDSNSASHGYHSQETKLITPHLNIIGGDCGSN